MRNVAGKAVSVLIKQMDDPNPWVAQQAARTVIQFVQGMESKDTTVTVNFGAMPQPALPLMAEGTVTGEGGVA